MSVEGVDFLSFADKCIKDGNEIGFRNAIGRAYYGVYHNVCSVLEKCGPTTHTGVSDYLISYSWLKGNEPFEKGQLISIGAILKQLHGQRKWADYEIDADVKETDAQAVLFTAHKCMNKIKDMHEKVYPPVV